MDGSSGPMNAYVLIPLLLRVSSVLNLSDGDEASGSKSLAYFESRVVMVIPTSISLN